ncbi:Quaternary ammonium compound-resistance protein SugE [Piscirickettsia salmonis]|uniref:Guanidinium exporter n=1 Tax=Piscirickettsia salmonis TaxID=1238 RepID=A0A1L6TDJ1_PISSA|nr:multidrug efflux SMR transporter [Piscirickettsia salmonis]AKP74514.1 multidrug transporter [Piscirickettsia salmonis LF-89 = ATCC VR-1361]ALB23483.1 small Multidrug Resistance family protein [Piscirickettsia salmonis]ALY03361.1 multidrug transporter [Piscirickettsia salmonis]AMA42927.1 multidrug transporter [Piscirickettsia salmonis]AOS35395.1 multidrug transporter [Piscirickettsia salmonis]
MSAWDFLFLGGLLEISGIICLKLSDGFKKRLPTLLMVIQMGLSLYVLSHVFGVIPVGTAYAVWTGIGAVGIALVGMVYFNESKDWPRLVCIALIISGVIGLKLTS